MTAEPMFALVGTYTEPAVSAYTRCDPETGVLELSRNGRITNPSFAVHPR